MRHNSIRNVVFDDAREGGLRPEREKSGLLPSRPSEDGLAGGGTGRRPADLWLPCGPSGRGVALDFAVTSGLPVGAVRGTLSAPDAVYSSYEEYKRTHLGTGAACEAQGFTFTPMVFEANGGSWSGLARRTLSWVARHVAAARLEDPDKVSLRMAQRISVCLHRENARAILKRAAWRDPSTAQGGWWDEPGDEWQ